MLPGNAHLTQPSPQPEAEADNVSGRPDFVDVFVQGNRPIPATAVRAVTPREQERRATRLESVTLYLPEPSPEMSSCARGRRIRTDCLAHVALLDYPGDQRNEEDIRRTCSRFGLLLEVDPACFAAPDLSPVRVVVKLQQPREIPREVRIRYSDFVSRHVVPVQILKVWDRSQSIDANGQYVPIYSHAAAAPYIADSP
uniref:Uncharacterized protein n=1 Tax=Oryza meridionalis TaxID=40149 RepID=A0A0E0CBF8_9ORYZ